MTCLGASEAISRIQMQEFEDSWEEEGIGIEHIVRPTGTRPTSTGQTTGVERIRRTGTRPPTRQDSLIRLNERPQRVVSEVVSPRPRPRRKNVLEMKQELLSTLKSQRESQRRTRINPYIATDNTTIAMKMRVGYDIKPKAQKNIVYEESGDSNWEDIIDYVKLFTNPRDDGYSVSDIRLLANKTRLVNVDRSVWDRFALLNILVDYLVDRRVYDDIKEASGLSSNTGEKMVTPLDRTDVLSEHYGEDTLWKLIQDSDGDPEVMRSEAQRLIADVEGYYESTIIDDERDEAIMEGLGEVYGNVLYLFQEGTDRYLQDLSDHRGIFDILPEDTTIGMIDDIPEGRFNLIILDHALDRRSAKGSDLIEHLRGQLTPNGRLAIISYDFGYNSSGTRMRDPSAAFSTLNAKMFVDEYLIPPVPHFDLSTISTDYPDEPQLRSWVAPLELADSFTISDQYDPIVEIVRIYS